MAAAPLLHVVFLLFLPWWLETLGVVGALLLAPVLGLVLAVVYTPLAVAVAALVKRLVVGRAVADRIPAWTGRHLRHWIVERVAGVVPWGFLQDTVFLNGALRRFGARIGERVHIHRGVDVARGGWDLLDIGDDAAIGQDAALRTVLLDDGHLVMGAVRVGEGAVVETRGGMDPGTALETGACLAALSWLPAGRRVPEGERWSGVPAMPSGTAPQPPTPLAGERQFSPHAHGVLTILARFVRSTLVYFAGVVAPAALGLHVWGFTTADVLDWLYRPATSVGGVIALASFTVATLVLGTALSAWALRLLGRVRPGAWSRWGWRTLRVFAKRDAVTAAGRWLSGTLLWPRWLRAAGMRVGPDCEVSSIVDVVPETIAIGEGSFLADGIYLGGPVTRRGVVEVGDTRLGARTFLGNHVVIPTGAALPDDLLIGSATVAAGAPFRPGSSWFGHPIFELPRREVVEVDRRLTHEPGWIRRMNRWTWELARFLLPIPPLLVFVAWLGALEAAWDGGWSAAYLFGVVPAASLAAGAALVLAVVLLKWVLLGRVRPGRHALWSCWCSRWDFLYVAWGAWCRPVLSALEGTLLLAWPLRLFGARIGRRVLLGGGFAQLVDPDMIHLGDGATASPLYQAHSFEDRVLKIDHVHVSPGATIGPGAILFYGATAGEGTHVAAQAVVMKHETLTPGRRYEGAPAGEVR